MELAKAQGAAPHGGQVIVDNLTLDGIKPHLKDLVRAQQKRGSVVNLTELAR